MRKFMHTMIREAICVWFNYRGLLRWAEYRFVWCVCDDTDDVARPLTITTEISTIILLSDALGQEQPKRKPIPRDPELTISISDVTRAAWQVQVQIYLDINTEALPILDVPRFRPGPPPWQQQSSILPPIRYSTLETHVQSTKHFPLTMVSFTYYRQVS